MGIIKGNLILAALALLFVAGYPTDHSTKHHKHHCTRLYKHQHPHQSHQCL
jgi:hypothetical protein